MASTLDRGTITSRAVRSANSSTFRIISAGSRPKRPERSTSSTRISTSASATLGSDGCSPSCGPSLDPIQSSGTASGSIAISRAQEADRHRCGPIGVLAAQRGADLVEGSADDDRGRQPEIERRARDNPPEEEVEAGGRQAGRYDPAEQVAGTELGVFSTNPLVGGLRGARRLLNQGAEPRRAQRRQCGVGTDEQRAKYSRENCAPSAGNGTKSGLKQRLLTDES